MEKHLIFTKDSFSMFKVLLASLSTGLQYFVSPFTMPEPSFLTTHSAARRARNDL